MLNWKLFDVLTEACDHASSSGILARKHFLASKNVIFVDCLDLLEVDHHHILLMLMQQT